MTDRTLIPNPVIATCADLLGRRLGHVEIDSLLMRAGAPGDAPDANRIDKVKLWLRRANETVQIDPLAVLGRTIRSIMNEALDPDERWHQERIAQRDELIVALAEHGLRYVGGGQIASGASTPSRSLAELLRSRDHAAIEAEFLRAGDGGRRATGGRIRCLQHS